LTDATPIRRPRPAVRAAGAVASFYFLGFLLSAILLLPLARRLTTGISPADLAAHPTPLFALIQGLLLLASFSAATWVVGVKALRLDATDLRWRTPMAWASGLGTGLALGILHGAVAMTLGVFTAGATWTHDGGSLPQWLAQVGKTVLILAPAALAEEIMFRGAPLVIAARAIGRPRAIVVLSLAFAFAHIRNPDVTAAGLVNIAVAGIFLSLAFYSPGGMWTAIGAHLGWNVTLAALAAPVSGLPFDIPYIDYRSGGPGWLTGGAFGPEGGLLATVALTATAALVARWIRKDPT